MSFIIRMFTKHKTLNTMGQVAKDIEVVKTFVDKCIESLENGDYAYISDGYHGGNDGGRYDTVVQSHANKIVSKLLSLGYIHTTNHGFGCKDWKFYKEIDL